MLRNLFWRTPGEKFNLLMYPFLFVTLINGLAFTFFGWANSVQASPLWQITQIGLGPLPLSIWGALAIIAVLLTILNLIYRKRSFGRSAGYVGSLIWVYAIIIYLLGGYTFQAILSLSQLFFWIWHLLRIDNYYYEFKD